MASGAAAGDGGFVWGMLEGCISSGDMGVKRRPYHRNCKCALHKSGGGGSSHRCTYNNVSYPIRKTWSAEGSLASPPSPSNSSSPVVASTTGNQIVRRVRTHMVLLELLQVDELVRHSG